MNYTAYQDQSDWYNQAQDFMDKGLFHVAHFPFYQSFYVKLFEADSCKKCIDRVGPEGLNLQVLMAVGLHRPWLIQETKLTSSSFHEGHRAQGNLEINIVYHLAEP